MNLLRIALAALGAFVAYFALRTRISLVAITQE